MLLYSRNQHNKAIILQLEVLVTQLCLTLCNPMDYRPQDSSIRGDSPGKNTGVEQNRKPTDKSMHLWTPYLCQKKQEYTMEKRQILQKVVLGKLESYM